MVQKAIIFDSGTLINFTMNGLEDDLRDLKGIFHGNFLITEAVKNETIRTPMNIKKFELGALKIQALLKDRTIELPSSLRIKDNFIQGKTKEILDLANNTFFADARPIHLIDKGEASSLVLSEILNKKGIKNVIAIDERTTRMLCEKPENLGKLLEKKIHTNIQIKKENLNYFSRFKIIRSSELVFIAYKKGLIDLKEDNVLDALLYAIKYRGCSISKQEIEEMKKL